RARAGAPGGRATGVGRRGGARGERGVKAHRRGREGGRRPPRAPPPPAPAEAGQRDAEILALQSKIAGRRARAHKLREEIEGYRGRLDRLTADEIRGLLDELAADVAEVEK